MFNDMYLHNCLFSHSNINQYKSSITYKHQQALYHTLFHPIERKAPIGAVVTVVIDIFKNMNIDID